MFKILGLKINQSNQSFAKKKKKKKKRKARPHRPVRLPEPHHPALGVLKLVPRQLHLVHLHDGVPELRVPLPEHDDEPGRLRVEGAGHVLDGVGDELLDAAVRDGGLVGQLVVRPAGLDGLEQRLGVGHFLFVWLFGDGEVR